MTDFIGRLITWVRLLPAGRVAHPAQPPSLSPTIPPPPGNALVLPCLRRPYGLDADTPLDGAATRSVRPYLTAHEQRRRALAAGALRLDVSGSYWIHGAEVA